MLDIKPTHKPIKEYFDELASFEKHGQTNEMTIRNAFQDVLQIDTKKIGLQFVEEYTIKRTGRCNASVDGALLDQLCSRLEVSYDSALVGIVKAWEE